jgi:PilZ domain
MSSQPLLPDRNRRVAPRKVVRQTATLIQGDTIRTVQTWDLGRDGMCLLSPRPVAPGSRCKATFNVPLESGPMSVTAGLKIVYSSYSASGEFKIGAVFTDLDEGVAVILETFAAAS